MEYRDPRELRPHPDTEIIPWMTDGEWEAFLEDVRERGVERPIEILGDLILDGRHRWKASLNIGRRVPTVQAEIEGITPGAYALRKALLRRNMSLAQRAFLAARMTRQISLGQGARTDLACGRVATRPKSRDLAGGMLKVSGRTVQKALLLMDEAPDLFAGLERDEFTVNHAYSTLSMRRRDEALQAIREQEVFLPAGPFDVMVVDPPWPYDMENTNRSPPYPQMTLEEITEWGLENLAPAVDCVLWLWTTNRHICDAHQIMAAWGFRKQGLLTWVKDRMGLGHWLRSQTEHCLLGSKGIPPYQFGVETTALHGPRREHSRKPEEFYQLVERVCGGRKVDYFSREPRPGWAQAGNEPERFSREE